MISGEKGVMIASLYSLSSLKKYSRKIFNQLVMPGSINWKPLGEGPCVTFLSYDF
jgi:hypothetical protein